MGGPLSKNLFSTSWLVSYEAKRQTSNRKKSMHKAVTLGDWENPQKRSAHRIALDILEKKPELIEGQQEHYAQVRIFYHFECHNPELYDLLHATPNGGMRTKATAGKMKAEGQKSGYPDMSLDAPKGSYHGMRLELKVAKNSITSAQKNMLNALSAQGYYCVLAYGHEEAIAAIEQYWGLPDRSVLPPHPNDHKWKVKQ